MKSAHEVAAMLPMLDRKQSSDEWMFGGAEIDESEDRVRETLIKSPA